LKTLETDKTEFSTNATYSVQYQNNIIETLKKCSDSL